MVPKSVTLSDLEWCNDRRPALSISAVAKLLVVVYGVHYINHNFVSAENS